MVTPRFPVTIDMDDDQFYNECEFDQRHHAADKLLLECGRDNGDGEAIVRDRAVWSTREDTEFCVNEE